MSAPPSRLEIRFPDKGFLAGHPGQIEIRLTDSEAKASPTPRPLTLDLASDSEFGLPRTIELKAGDSGVDVVVTPKEPGLVGIEVRAEGMSAGHGVAAIRSAVEEPTSGQTSEMTSEPVGLPVEVAVALPSGAEPLSVGEGSFKTLSYDEARSRPETRWQEAIQDLESRVREKTGEVASNGANPSEAPESNHQVPSPSASMPTMPPAASILSPRVELIPQQAEIEREETGWPVSRLDAFWVQGPNRVPIPAAQAVNLRLIAEGPGGDVLPLNLTIPQNEIVASQPAVIRALRRGELSITALYSGGSSVPVKVHFLADDPTHLDLWGRETYTGLSVVKPQYSVRLLNAKNQAVPAASLVKVKVFVQGDAETQMKEVTILPNEEEAPVELTLDRHGRYTIRASAPHLDDATKTISYQLDLWMIAVALGGGFVGSLIRRTFKGGRKAPLVRTLTVGGFVGVLVLLLAVFNKLTWLEKIAPSANIWQDLSAIPIVSFVGMFMVTLLGGLLAESIVEAIVRRTQ
ncbi:MAG: hypothetical protein ABJC13_08350 [Acidobacteriota bacterium]